MSRGQKLPFAADARTSRRAYRYSPAAPLDRPTWRPAEMLARQRLSLLRNLKSVGVQVQKYRFGDMRALFWRDPVIVQIRTAIALGIFDKSRMNGVRNQFFYGVSRHIASCFTPRHSTARDRSATVGPW